MVESLLWDNLVTSYKIADEHIYPWPENKKSLITPSKLLKYLKCPAPSYLKITETAFLFYFIYVKRIREININLIMTWWS